MEFRCSTCFRWAMRRRRLYISRPRHRSSSVSMGSMLIHSSSGRSTSWSPCREEAEQTEVMEEERARLGLHAGPWEMHYVNAMLCRRLLL
jgi:hypothetical protein